MLDKLAEIIVWTFVITVCVISTLAIVYFLWVAIFVDPRAWVLFIALGVIGLFFWALVRYTRP